MGAPVSSEPSVNTDERTQPPTNGVRKVLTGTRGHSRFGRVESTGPQHPDSQRTCGPVTEGPPNRIPGGRLGACSIRPAPTLSHGPLADGKVWGGEMRTPAPDASPPRLRGVLARLAQPAGVGNGSPKWTVCCLWAGSPLLAGGHWDPLPPVSGGHSAPCPHPEAREQRPLTCRLGVPKRTMTSSMRPSRDTNTGSR